MDDVREKRKILGWSRAELAVRAHVDPRTLQLLELGESEDTEARERVLAVLDAALADRLDA
ncbi:MAG: helix-turn-helix transcriptional regulator [Deltaproteobacteria bacterium]|nr:helix-turn-helix transcriptional regulator [Deltaproteobacteria bacterium]